MSGSPFGHLRTVTVVSHGRRSILDRYRRVTPALVVDGAVRALGFYADVFGARERIYYPRGDGTIAHAEMEIGDSVVIVKDACPAGRSEVPLSTRFDRAPFSLRVYVEDVDEVIDRAVRLGARLVRSPTDQLYGDRDGFVVDPFGHGWTIANHTEDVPPQEIVRRMIDRCGGVQG
jgi:PhnB protein